MRKLMMSAATLGLFFVAAAAPTGSIAGIVTDAATRSPLAGASIVVLNTVGESGTVTYYGAMSRRGAESLRLTADG